MGLRMLLNSTGPSGIGRPGQTLEEVAERNPISQRRCSCSFSSCSLRFWNPGSNLHSVG